MAKRVSISDCCLNEHDHLILKSLLSLVETHTGVEWKYLDSNNADVVVVDIDSQEGNQLWNKALAGGKVWVGLGENPHISGENIIISKPLRSRDLIEALNNALSFLTGLTSPGTLIQPATPDVEAALLHFLAENIENRQGCFEVHHGSAVLILDFTNRLARFTGNAEELMMISRAPSESVSITSCTNDLKSDESSKPLGTITWYAAIFGSKGQPLPAISQVHQYKLKRFPNLRTLKKRPEYGLLAGALSKNWLAIDKLQMFSGLKAEDIYSFLNACYLSGLLNLEGQKTAASSHNNPQKKNEGLFGKLRRKLGMGELHS